ncbi:Platelet-activating factor acetylhydrolase-like [Trypanosoma melophagium]|uniref:Platelet-activating factor acetylhydrolase-like n=1 Tax=Trypanosoma melophagium TaxID=715481 RepID=UPI00351A7815|nr:Platelet-activating factor acetylhydrolase-like [Trypanosoma melophagium]
MKFLSRDWLLSLHLLPLESCIVLSALFLFLSPNSVFWSLLFFAVGSLTTVALFVILPLSPLKSVGAHSVGIRHLNRNLAVYYPTFIQPIEGEPWLPGNDSSFIYTMAKQTGVRSMWLKHLKLVRIPCTRNASVVSLMTHKGEPRQVFIISHNYGTHHLSYSYLALALASCGALVYTILHSDNTDVSIGKSRIGSLAATEEDSLQDRSLIHERRMTQLTKRVEDVIRLIEGFSQGEMLQPLQVRPSEWQTFLSSGAKVNLIGHGFGALTMIAVAFKAPTSVAQLIESITAMDTWPLNLVDDLTRGQQYIPSHIHMQLVDSEEWSKRREHGMQEEELKEFLTSFGVDCIRKTYTGTDHASVTDMGLLAPVTRRKQFASKKSSTFIPLVAKEIMRFAQGFGSETTTTLV